jgi:hypothetical protein
MEHGHDDREREAVRVDEEEGHLPRLSVHRSSNFITPVVL